MKRRIKLFVKIEVDVLVPTWTDQTVKDNLTVYLENRLRTTSRPRSAYFLVPDVTVFTANELSADLDALRAFLWRIE